MRCLNHANKQPDASRVAGSMATGSGSEAGDSTQSWRSRDACRNQGQSIMNDTPCARCGRAVGMQSWSRNRGRVDGGRQGGERGREGRARRGFGLTKSQGVRVSTGDPLFWCLQGVTGREGGGGRGGGGGARTNERGLSEREGCDRQDPSAQNNGESVKGEGRWVGGVAAAAARRVVVCRLVTAARRRWVVRGPKLDRHEMHQRCEMRVQQCLSRVDFGVGSLMDGTSTSSA